MLTWLAVLISSAPTSFTGRAPFSTSAVFPFSMPSLTALASTALQRTQHSG